MPLCEEVLHLEMDYVDEGSGLERSIGGRFGTIWQYFRERNGVLRDSDLDLCNPIVNKDVDEVCLADRDSGKERYLSTMRVFMKVVEKKENVVSIEKKRAAMDGWLGGIAKFTNVDKGSMFKAKIPATGGRLLLTGSGYKA